ncbi:MAG TPA: hypothetical protein VJ873_04525 [bacterium]|nr:hypothetical protein [bacterium]
MNWKEILIIACIYGLVILSGYGTPRFIAFFKAHCAALITVAKAENTAWKYVTKSFGL